jgi:multidrug efflux system membrane fusion protein
VAILPTVKKADSVSDVIKERPVTTFERSKETVSMSPQVPSHGSRPTGWGGVLSWLIFFALAGAGWYYREAWWPWVSTQITNITGGANGGAASKGPPPPRIVPVVTAVVQQKDMDVFINGLGTVTAFKTVTIRSRVEGELVKVAFTEGQMVQEKDLLAEIDRRPFDVQLQQAEGQLARDEATMKSADFTLKRYQELINSKAITAQQVDEQRALVQQMTGAIQSDQAAVENAKLQLAYCHIAAPIGGRIGLRLVDQGNIVRANDPMGLAVITQLQPIALVFTIPQDDIVRVQKPQRERESLVVDAYDRDFKTKLASGKLLAIDNQVDATTGTVRIKAVFDNEDGLLFPNQFVNARLLVDTRRNAVVVPNAAVQRGPGSTFVYVVKSEGPDDKVELRTVKTGLIEGAETAIDSGLEPGEIVVTEGLDKLTPGASVRTREKEKAKEKEKERAKEKEGDRGKKSEHENKPESHDGHTKPKNETASESGKKGSS